MTRSLIFLLILFLSSCTLPEEKKARAEQQQVTDTTHLRVTDTNLATGDVISPAPIQPPQPVKAPSGIYRGTLPVNGKVEQTIAFYKNRTFRLQEAYEGRDSVVITEGTWTPSDGFIWLYKDQVAYGRYRWKGDTLMYYSPFLKKNFSMAQMKEAADHPAWVEKRKEGVLLFGVGNEPFWSIELKKDSLSFQLSDWDKPLRLKLGTIHHSGDSSSFEAASDSANIQLIVYPYFCSDGMSDFIYRNRIRVNYNGQAYRGCGMEMDK